jgi:hypothetical protein
MEPVHIALEDLLMIVHNHILAMNLPQEEEKGTSIIPEHKLNLGLSNILEMAILLTK